MTKPTFDKLEGEVFMHDHQMEDILGLTGVFLFKGEINVNSDFPTSLLVDNGWCYAIGTDVTDNDASKTNTGQSFLEGDEIAWNGTNWSTLPSGTIVTQISNVDGGFANSVYLVVQSIDGGTA